MRTHDELNKLTLRELREECLNTIGCKTKQDYIYRIIEEEAAACCDGGDDDDDGAGDDEWKALYAGTEQHDNQAGIHTNAEKEAGVKGGYAAGNGDPAAAAAAAAAAGSSSKQLPMHRPVSFPAGTAAGSRAAAAVALQVTSQNNPVAADQPPSAGMAADAEAAAAEGPDWLALPPGIIRGVIGLASTCQAPGFCLAAPVCRTWRAAAGEVAGAAAAKGSGIHLLYRAGHAPADCSLATWFRKHSGLLKSLILSGSDSSSMDKVLGALADVAAAAVGAGSPLQLHTLRLLEASTRLSISARVAMPSMYIMARLVKRLPHLRCLQLDMSTSDVAAYSLMEALEQATQLQELYIIGPTDDYGSSSMVASLLPTSLKRLGLETSDRHDSVPDLSHLNNLRFLHLERFLLQQGPFTRRLPPGLQELEASNVSLLTLEMLQGEAQILTGCSGRIADEMQVLTRYSNMKTLFHVQGYMFPGLEVSAALQKLVHLSAMEVYVNWACLQRITSAASNLQGLRRLRLSLIPLTGDPAGLGDLTQLTQLVVASMGNSQEQPQRAWAAEVGRMSGLRWLSVPHVLLAADQAWLGGLKQLQVLGLSRQSWMPGDTVPQVLPQEVEGLEGCSPQALPPRLLLLGVTGVTPEQAVSWQVRGRLQQRLASSGCEVVVGVDLDEVAAPMKQLAGLPVALQQALA